MPILDHLARSSYMAVTAGRTLPLKKGRSSGWSYQSVKAGDYTIADVCVFKHLRDRIGAGAANGMGVGIGTGIGRAAARGAVAVYLVANRDRRSGPAPGRYR
jgi:hypothetical protein